MGKRLLPKWFGDMTIHQWRSIKRQELREARKALDTCRIGCAVQLPPEAARKIVDAHKLIDEAITLCSVRRWGR